MQKSVKNTNARAKTPVRGSNAAKAPAPNRRRSSTGWKSEKASPNVLPKLVLFGIAFIAACFLLQKYVFPGGVSVNDGKPVVAEIDAATSVRVTEVMSSNASVIQDEKGVYADWIEVTNVSGASVNLRDWKLAKDSSLMLKYFEFPNHTLAPGESAIVFCTSTSQNSYGYAYHAPFKISAAGDTIILYNPSDAAVQSLNVPELTANHSYAEIDGSWVITDEPTPGMANTSENYHLLHDNRELADSPIYLTELMAKNVSYAPDENGEYLDWVEIYNSSAYTVSLSGYSLSDSFDNLQKWRFPNVSIGPGEYLLVYCSGYDRRDPDGNLHTNFRLSTEKECAILTNASGQLISCAEYDLLKADQSYALQADGTWTTLIAPTPGMTNSFSSAALIDSQFAAQNNSGVFINEVMASTNISMSGNASYDWVELFNSSGRTVDLSGWGLSDDAGKPRKWQFPAGTTIAPGAYMGIYLSGLNEKKSGNFHTSFRLSSSEGETLVLAYPDGKIADRCALGAQYANISYGRINGRAGFYYFTASTPVAVNIVTGYESRMTQPVFSVQGGMYPSDKPITLTLTSDPEATIYYTLDSSTPDPAAVGGAKYTPDPEVSYDGVYETLVYTGPISITKNTVVRAVSVKDGQMSSMVATQTYLMGESHTMNVASLVMNPYDLWDYNKGLYVKGPNAYASSPYGSINKGANFWMTWEKDANIELFSPDGETILSQGCGVRLHGQYSRKEDQKAFKLIARSKYGSSRFRASLFPNRDYTEYQSFLLRASGQDVLKTRMRDSILQSLTAGSSVMYQDTNLCVVYLNGEYWGQYNMRERVNPYSICQWEGWDPALKDDIDLIKANTSVMQGSVDTWTQIKDWYAKNGIETDEELEYVKQFIDVDNYLEYIAVQIYTGNTDLLNCKKYRLDGVDGRWKWVLFDMDWAFTTDTNSVGRWLKPGGVGTDNKTDNSLFIALMKNEKCKDQFLTYFAEKLRTSWSTASVLNMISERYALLEPEIERHLDRWNVQRSEYDQSVKQFSNYAKQRPGRLLYFFANVLSRSEMEHYFGDLLETVTLLDDKKNPYDY